jgi:hypothetical protein
VWVFRAPLATLIGMSAVACGGSSAPLVSSAAPPTIVCGTTLSASPAGAVVEDATRSHVVTATTIGGFVIIRVTRDCAHGARVRWSPHGSATLIKQAKSKDGLSAAVVLQPATSRSHFTVTATRRGMRVAYAEVRLAR